MDFERLELPVFDPQTSFDAVQQRLLDNLSPLLAFLEENYNLVTLSIESNYQSLYDTASKRLEYVSFLQREYVHYFSSVVANVTDEKESQQLLDLITRYDYLFQVHDSISDLFNARRTMSKQYIELKSDLLLMVRELSGYTVALFDSIQHADQPGERQSTADAADQLRRELARIKVGRAPKHVTIGRVPVSVLEKY